MPQAQAANPAPAVIDRVLQDAVIKESSGLARSRLSDTRLWTHNDSGGGNTIYALGSGGKISATYQLTGATFKDWEGMASAIKDGVSYLYVGDIGDNGKKRPTIFVHRVREPQPGAASGALTPTTYEFRYPDGAHNSETLMVHPTTQRIYIVTKSTSGGAVYVAPSTLSTTSVNVLTKLASAPAGLSDGVFMDDGRFVLRAYQSAFLYAAVGATAYRFLLPDKGEGITIGWTSATLITSREGALTPLYRVTIP